MPDWIAIAFDNKLYLLKVLGNIQFVYLFGAIMSLLSHDHWEVEYEYADTSNTGIDTKSNVVRGWPSVIFAQAVDYSNYSRWPEVQRRFIITNPNMDTTKYNAAIDLMADKFGSPDFAYQVKHIVLNISF